MTNVTNKYYESLEDWEKLTVKNFVSFRVNIAPTLPPNATPSAQVQVTKPSPVTNDPLRDWKKGTNHDMNIFKELKRTKEWKQWDTQFCADVATDKISTSLALDSLHKIRVSWVKNQVSARSDAQICFLS